jgi:ubiquinone/menaquinone biosynthesis C-methylase UbiE
MQSASIKAVAEAFSRQSIIFDSLDESNPILQWMRSQVHLHCMKYFKAGETLLELNCGTGIDAVFFAMNGLQVHATDIADGMLEELRKKIELKNLSANISSQKCSFKELNTLSHQKFNHIFSNFGGLNCTNELDKVISQFKNLLQPGGTVTLVIMPPICLWEFALALKGNFRTAFRRLRKNGTDSNVEGMRFNSYYYSPSKVSTYFGNQYKLIALKSLACFVPPPYLEKFPHEYPKLFKLSTLLDEKLSSSFPFNRWADHYIITMQKL